MRFILTSLIGLAMLAVSLACNAAAPVKTTTVDASATQSSPSSAPVSNEADDSAPRITLADAKKSFDAGEAIFIDTRGADFYNLEHIKGAINITMNDVDNRYKEIPQGKKIIAYCS